MGVSQKPINHSSKYLPLGWPDTSLVNSDEVAQFIALTRLYIWSRLFLRRKKFGRGFNPIGKRRMRRLCDIGGRSGNATQLLGWNCEIDPQVFVRRTENDKEHDYD